MSVALFARFYPWTKALHIIAVIAWMAGMLYLPRLFVYHAAAQPGSVVSEQFKVMELRLYRFIMLPAMLAALFFGVILMLTPGLVDWHQGWFHVKLLMVLVLLAVHGMMGKWRRNFLTDRNTKPQRFYRIMNEVPTVAMIVIVIMVVVQPF